MVLETSVREVTGTRFIDDMLVLANSDLQLQRSITNIIKMMEERMKESRETKVMRIHNIEQSTIVVMEWKIQVEKFGYLGTMLTEDLV